MGHGNPWPARTAPRDRAQIDRPLLHHLAGPAAGRRENDPRHAHDGSESAVAVEIESGDGVDLLVQPRRQPLQRPLLRIEEPERFRPLEVLLIREQQRDPGVSTRAGHARGLYQEAGQGDGGGLVGAGAGGVDVGGLGVRGGGEEKEKENLFHFVPPLK